ncbi:MAG: hypothetical protein ACRDN6_11145 [Gaiellaceae bacterium]
MHKRPLLLLFATLMFVAVPAIAGGSPQSGDSATGSAKFAVVEAHVVVSAHSGPLGEDAHGHFSLDQGVGDIQLWAEVTCLNVQGNLASIGGVTVKSRSGLPAGTGVLQIVQDVGSPGDMDRSQTFIVATPPVVCPAPFPPGFEADQGNYVVNDELP